eukprot:Rmarinus@m.9975
MAAETHNPQNADEGFRLGIKLLIDSYQEKTAELQQQAEEWKQRFQTQCQETETVLAQLADYRVTVAHLQARSEQTQAELHAMARDRDEALASLETTRSKLASLHQFKKNVEGMLHSDPNVSLDELNVDAVGPRPLPHQSPSASLSAGRMQESHSFGYEGTYHSNQQLQRGQNVEERDSDGEKEGERGRGEDSGRRRKHAGRGEALGAQAQRGDQDGGSPQSLGPHTPQRRPVPRGIVSDSSPSSEHQQGGNRVGSRGDREDGEKG